MKQILLFLIPLLFLGCGGSSKPEPISYPSWYLNPPQNSGSFLYGVGEGGDINSAKASALSSVSASLSITVSSKLKKSESSSSFNGDENSYRSVVNSLKTEVKEMEFSDYKIIQNQMLNSRFLVLVEVSRQRLFSDQKSKLDLYSDELKEEQREIKKHSLIKQAFLFDKSLQKTQKLKSLALLNKTIDSNFNTKPYMQQASDIATLKQDALSRVKVSISASKEAKIFADALKEGLNSAGIKTVSSSANTRLYLKNRFQTDEIYGFKIAKSNLSISTKVKNKTLASNTLTLSGKSRYDYDKAKQNAAHILRLRIKKDGIFSILGIK